MDLDGRVLQAAHLGSLEDVVDRLGPAHHDPLARLRPVPVGRDPPHAQVLEVPVDDLADVVVAQDRADLERQVLRDPGHGLVHVEHGAGRRRTQAARLPAHDDSRDGEHDEDRHHRQDNHHQAQRLLGHNLLRTRGCSEPRGTNRARQCARQCE